MVWAVTYRGGLFDGLFGQGHGHGAHSWFDDLSSGIFDGVHGVRYGAYADELWMGARSFGAGESVFARACRFAQTAANHYIDYELLRDIRARRGGDPEWSPFEHFEDWLGGDKNDAKTVATLRETIKGHGFIAKQLKNFPQHAELAEEYSRLGEALPSEELLGRAHKALSSKFHPDKNPIGGALMTQLNVARDAIGKGRAEYNETLRDRPDLIKKLFQKAHDTEWDKVFDAAYSKTRPRLTGPLPAPKEGIAKWVHELSPSSKAGLIFGTAAVVGLGIYGLAKASEKKHPKPEKPQPNHVAQVTVSNPNSSMTR